MLVYDTYDGNVHDGTHDHEPTETVAVDDDQRRRSRFRTTTDTGREIGVVAARELRGGDVLVAGETEAPPIRVTLESIEAVAVDLADAAGDLTTAVALGHAAGNRHWDVAVREQTVLFPATESDERIADTLDPHLPAGATVGRETVSPALFDDTTPHDDHSHSHDHPHTHRDHSHEPADTSTPPGNGAGSQEGTDD